MSESTSLANLTTPMLNSGVLDAIKNMSESTSLANLTTPMLNSGVLDAIKNMSDSEDQNVEKLAHKNLRKAKEQRAPEDEK